MVGLILAFIFFAPARIFHDHPRPRPSRGVAVVLLQQEPATVYEVVGAKAEAALPALLQQTLGHPVRILNVQAVTGSMSAAPIYRVTIR